MFRRPSSPATCRSAHDEEAATATVVEEVPLILVGGSNWSKKAGGRHVGVVGGFKITDCAGEKLIQPPPAS